MTQVELTRPKASLGGPGHPDRKASGDCTRSHCPKAEPSAHAAEAHRIDPVLVWPDAGIAVAEGQPPAGTLIFNQSRDDAGET